GLKAHLDRLAPPEIEFSIVVNDGDTRRITFPKEPDRPALYQTKARNRSGLVTDAVWGVRLRSAVETDLSVAPPGFGEHRQLMTRERRRCRYAFSAASVEITIVRQSSRGGAPMKLFE